MIYSLSFPNPLSRYVLIELKFKANASNLIIQIPSWRPGRYEIADYAERVRFSGKTAHSLSRINNNTWKLKNKKDEDIVLLYEYYANHMDAGNSYVDEEQIYINFINCLIFPSEHQNELCTVSIDIPTDYSIATSLPGTGSFLTQGTLTELFDAPIMASKNMHSFAYTVQETVFHLHINGNNPMDMRRVLTDFKRLTTTQLELFGDFPSDNYHFLIHSLEYRHYHGVEHKNSTVITLGPSSALPTTLYPELLGVASHELFHVWNVCTIKPAAFYGINYTMPIYTDCGFVLEGITTYYGDLMLWRSGVFSQETYLQELNKILNRHLSNQGRHHTSLSTSSEELWLNGYKPGAPAKKVSIYMKGAICAFLMDLKIRSLTNNQQNLDQVMQLLWEQYRSKGYDKNAVYEIFETVGGPDIRPFYLELYDGVKDLTSFLTEQLPLFGMSLEKQANKEPVASFLGIQLSDYKNGGKIIQVDEQAPAFKLLAMDDELISINGKQENWKIEPGSQPIKLEIKRQGRLLSILLPVTAPVYFQAYYIAVQNSAGYEFR